MTSVLCAVLAATSVWSCPGLQRRHAELRGEFIQAMAKGDADGMASASLRGTQLVEDDPVWRYNLACSLARKGEREAALDALEKAVSLGYRDADGIAADADLEPLFKEPRFAAAVSDARRPWSGAAAEGPFQSFPPDRDSGSGPMLVLGAQNMRWDFDAGAFVANVSLPRPTAAEPYAGLAYVNLDRRHSTLNVYDYPGLIFLMLDQEGTSRGHWQNFPNTLFPCPVFGNCSRAHTQGPNWRSLPRAAMTAEAARLPFASRCYLSNQVWAYPAARDSDVSTNGFGDVFTSVAPYWIVTHGYSWSDLPYLGLALKATAAMDAAAREEIVSKGLLAPTIQMLLRKSLKGVRSEDDYLTSAAHPTAFPPNGVDAGRLMKLAAALRPGKIPPVALIAGVGSLPVLEKPEVPEMLYASPCAAAFVLRSPDTLRKFAIKAQGADEFAFAVVHGAAVVEGVRPDAAFVRIDKLKMSWTNRVDVAVFAKNKGTQWGAPSFVSFAVVDETAPYADPMLVPKKPKPAGDGASGDGASGDGKSEKKPEKKKEE